MALAIDGSTPAQATGTGTAVTTASFTPPAGALLTISYAANTSVTTDDVSITSITNTGTALTFTRRVRKNKNAASNGGVGEPGGAEIWTAPAASGAITVTVNGFGSGAGREKSVKVVVWTGADTANLANLATASNASGLPSAAVAGCLAGSHVLAVASDWNAAGAGTAGTAQTMIDEFHTGSQMTMHHWRTTSPLAGAGSQTMDLTAPSAQDYNLCALEIRDAGGAAPPVGPPLLIMQAVNRSNTY